MYTEDRGWMSAADLYVGERIRGDHGDLTVTNLIRDPGVHRVYNIDVEADHVYYVGELAALSHNIADCTPPELPDVPNSWKNPESVAFWIRTAQQAQNKLIEFMNSGLVTPTQIAAAIDMIAEWDETIQELEGVLRLFGN
jgi:hypothetical protein